MGHDLSENSDNYSDESGIIVLRKIDSGYKHLQ